MLIIVEGSDGLGKTTLAKSLQSTMRSAYVHYGPLPAWWRKDLYLTALSHAVYDRYYWSTWAYSLVYKQPVIMTASECVELDAFHRAQCANAFLSVVLYASEDSFFDDRAEDPLFKAEQIKAVNDRYREYKHAFDVAIDVCKGYPQYEWNPLCDAAPKFSTAQA